ncbi:M28 family peptidase [Planctomycetota bacterium]
MALNRKLEWRPKCCRCSGVISSGMNRSASTHLSLTSKCTNESYSSLSSTAGVAAMLEIAQYLSDQKGSGKFSPKRDVVFAGWSGEEIGLIGSSHFVKSLGDEPYPKVSSCINMDMVGRLDKKLVLQGVGSSSIWPSEIERRNIRLGIPISIQNDSYIPTDASVFFTNGIPILSAFTGSHGEYHTPRDTPDRLNYEGAAQVANFMGLVTRSLALRDDAPDYIEQSRPNEGQQRARLRATLGSIPDYAEGEVSGVALSGAKGPSAKAGVKAGDIVVELAGKKIENIYDYTYAIEALKIGQPVKMVVTRNGKRLELEIIPEARN